MRSPSKTLLPYVLGACLASAALAATITQVEQLRCRTYDYIIVGGGTAGLTLANRLSENPEVTVLVLEAGISDADQPLVTAPLLAVTISPNTIYDWNYTVTPQAALNNRTFPYPRGRLLGGTSSINYMFHQYGSTEDWDRLADVSGDAGWGWANMRKYVAKHERLVAPVDGHDTAGQVLPALHGTRGNLGVSLPGQNQSTDSRIWATMQQLEEFKFNEDTSGIDRPLLGLGYIQSAINNGVRSSSSTAYLAPANTRPNLTVLVNASVQKIVQTGADGGTGIFRGVQFTSSPGTYASPGALSRPGPIAEQCMAPVQVTARKEVILSAGTAGTAQILQLSGIGNAEDLQPLHIPVRVDSPMVGRNLLDHTFLSVIFSARGNAVLADHPLQDASSLGPAVNEFFTSHTGPLVNNLANFYGFARIPDNSSVYETHADPAAGPNSPHFEYIPANLFIRPNTPVPATGSYFTIVTALLAPTSRGSIKIASTDSFEQPLIDPQYLSADIDLAIVREAVKSAVRFASAPAWADYIIAPLSPLSTDEEIDDFIRDNLSALFHMVGTAKMAGFKADTRAGVVNPDLTVKNTIGLRVVDASVFPFIPSSHTQGPVYMLAERAADIIKKANECM